MSMRRRPKRTPQSKLDATPPWPARERPAAEATSGPYDVRDRPEDDVARVDLGGLLMPAASGFELRLDIGENQQVLSVTLANSSGHMQIGLFAAPRTQGIWDEVRTEIAESASSQGGAVRDREDGPFGTELIGTLKVDGRATPVRFIGIDGPRWFLRAMIVGAVAKDAVKARPLEAALRNIVVVRGSDPLPVREQVPLQMPTDALTLEDADSDPLDVDAIESGASVADAEELA
jgi:hypothetical protein